MRILPCLIGVVVLLSVYPGSGGTPGMINYQGLVTVNGSNFDGVGQFKFALVDGGTQTYWSHDGTGTGGNAPLSSVPVPVSKGLYSVMLGDTNLTNMSQIIPAWVFTNTEVFLRVWFDQGGSVQQLTPDQRIGSVGYALQAGSVDAGAIQAGMIADGAITSSKLASGAVKAFNLDDGGNAAYEQFRAPATSLGASNSLPFSALGQVATNGEVPPAFTFTLDGTKLGTVVGFTAQEGISEPYQHFVELVLPRPELEPDAQIGHAGRLVFTRSGRSTTFGGLITACSVASQGGTNALYVLRLESPLAYLALSTDYRLFQNLAVPEIATNLYQTVAPEGPVLSLSASHTPRACTVQYAEPSFRFFSRLLEDEGIFYFYRAAADTLILGDAPGAYLAAPNSPFVYYGNDALNAPAGEYIRAFQKSAHESTKTSTVAMRDFTKPGVQFGTAVSLEGQGQLYEFGSAALSSSALSRQAALRQQRQEVERAIMAGASTVPDLRPGYTFSLIDRTDSGLANTYLVTGVRHAGFRRTSNGVATLYYGNEFQVIPASLVYRPALKTPKPLAQACTAMVTGPAGGRTYVDQYGRVKVQFHWDRHSAADETASGWVRVASPVAGATHGMLFLPRLGDEVLVSFLQGDPDQPVITGSLYNGVTLPPFALPGAAEKSTIRSTSTGSGLNEILFDDTAGLEQLVISTPRLVLSSPVVAIDGAQYSRSNSVLAWAKVAADGSVSGTAYGVASVTNPKAGVYSITLDKAAQSASSLVPVAVATVAGQPTTPSAARLVTVDQVLNNAFNVYVLSGLGAPVNNAFTVIVTGQ